MTFVDSSFTENSKHVRPDQEFCNGLTCHSCQELKGNDGFDECMTPTDTETCSGDQDTCQYFFLSNPVITLVKRACMTAADCASSASLTGTYDCCTTDLCNNYVITTTPQPTTSVPTTTHRSVTTTETPTTHAQTTIAPTTFASTLGATIRNPATHLYRDDRNIGHIRDTHRVGPRN
ncbi:Hypp8595 [Branchiostoma lanceolatum]|uniref:Hypp8595 protein n=1 Tax=Branchiostoma lanceolatum TaxID=7740 RepID=A0A8J9Z9R8_BRALA|nr:Hypp8595 [Branchiostoma lanceolatum]